MRMCCALILVIVGCAAQENTRSISGSVIDASGALIPNTTVTLSGSTTIAVKTDNQGEFVFSTLEPGSYKLKFQQAGFKQKDLDITVDEEPIVLGEVLLDIGSLACPGIMVEGPAPPECSGSLCGSVRYGSAVVTDAIVFLQLSGESRRVKTIRTDANGSFQFNNVKAGLYDLTIETKGFKPAIIDSIGLQRGGQITLPLVQLQRPTTLVR